ncbi:ATP-dependent RNA helicase DDX24 [Armadillidium nasatum]|uniref:ATP-dependent RNA helicase n=1 Tax=Armadillidium nasatum TaxID=96803 RepID=A0A5N5T2Z0_9CRUS|nr:ATP-dependent RNA helicase DDX24 [Armadillidium nasatum]
MRMKRPKNRGNEVPLKINESEFEGLSSFEEIDSYSILQRVDKKGGKKKVKSKLKMKEVMQASNSTKPKDKIDKRKLDEKEDIPNKKPKYETVNIEAWKSIFVPDIILDAICELGFKEPTAIQKLTIPAAIEGRKDIVGAAETDKEENTSISKLRALVITPTRELAVQIKKHTDAILTKTDIKTALVIGGLNFEKQERLLKARPEIVIGTPGRLWEMIQKGNIDETDRMLERGHFEELNHILEQMNCFPEEQNKRQNFIFSATLTLNHDAPKRLKQIKKVEKVSTEMKLENFIKLIGLRTKPKIIDITRKFGTAESLSETKDEKDIYLYYFLKRFPGRTLIFCNSINCVKRLSNLLATLRCQPQTLHASKQQKQRLKSLERFTANNLSVLLATDVAARGIDIPGIKHIIHYEVPKTAETYVHRSGRTARANQEGLSVLLISSEEVNKYRQLCSTLNRSSDLPSFPVDYDLLENTRGRVSLAKEIELLQHRQNRKKRDELWFNKMKEEAELERDQSSDDDDDVAIAAVQKRKQSNEMKEKMAQLSQMLSKPLISSSFSGRYPTMSGKLVLPDRAFLNEVTEGAIDLVKQNKTNFSVIPKSNKPKWRKDRQMHIADSKIFILI